MCGNEVIGCDKPPPACDVTCIRSFCLSTNVTPKNTNAMNTQTYGRTNATVTHRERTALCYSYRRRSPNNVKPCATLSGGLYPAAVMGFTHHYPAVVSVSVSCLFAFFMLSKSRACYVSTWKGDWQRQVGTGKTEMHVECFGDVSQGK